MPHSSPLLPGLDRKPADSVRAGNDEQLAEAAQHEPVAVAPVQRSGGDGQAEFGEPVQQRPESDPALRTRPGG